MNPKTNLVWFFYGVVKNITYENFKTCNSGRIIGATVLLWGKKDNQQ